MIDWVIVVSAVLKFTEKETSLYVEKLFIQVSTSLLLPLNTATLFPFAKVSYVTFEAVPWLLFPEESRVFPFRS
jgi:hypothetical protein